MVSVFLGLGTNLGDRPANLRTAIDALGAIGSVEALSRVYETSPLYVTDQPAFLNMAIKLRTHLVPLALLDALKRLETDIGRVESFRYGPRLIDLDILFYGDEVVEAPRLSIPHPRLHERHFALVPLADIAPTLLHPTRGRTIRALLDALPEDDGIRLAADDVMAELVA